MIKKNLKILIITSLMTLLPIPVGAMLWDKLPEQMPIHWNMSGEVDDWCGKLFAVLGMPLILLAVQAFAVLAMSLDPKKKNHSGKILLIAYWCVPMLSNVMSAIIYMVALGKEVSVAAVISVFVGLIITVIGNYLPKCKQNYTVGIKIPWTLHSEENWNKTHRIAGWIWVVCGFIIAVSGCLGFLWIILPIALIMVIVPVIYSYTVYRAENKE